MVKLSVNINKAATLRNARGGNTPDIEQIAKDCESFGAQGITVLPVLTEGTSVTATSMPSSRIFVPS